MVARQAPSASEGAQAHPQPNPGEVHRSPRDRRRKPDQARQGDRVRQEDTPQADATEDVRIRGARVFNSFFGNVSADGAIFGESGHDRPGDPGGGRVEGRLEDADVAWLVTHFAPPAGYEEAATTLAEEGVIILAGEEGSGRRAGAIAMLAQVRSAGEPLVALSPAITVDRLAERSFNAGAGYLVGDMFADAERTELAHFYWRELCISVRKAHAYLVVTAATTSASKRSDVVRQFTWQRPSHADVLRAHLGEDYTNTKVIDRAAAAIGPGFRLADIAGVARRLREGEDPDNVIASLDKTDRQAVTAWLGEEDLETPALLEVAALAFSAGLPERLFEAELTELKARIADFTPKPEPHQNDETPARPEADPKFRQLRRLRSSHPLIGIRQVPVSHAAGALTVRHVDFSKPAYREQVVAELWGRLDYDFWVGVRAWLHDIAADEDDPSPLRPALMTSVAYGLALLAVTAPDEVFESYLLPWTAAGTSLDEQNMALYVVWQMTRLDQLAPFALQIAIAWAGQGSRIQRTLATLTFGGPLGARYPMEAVRRLSQLARQNDALAAWAHAQLFATLASQGSDGLVVLHELTRRMKKKAGPTADVVMRMIADLLAIQDPRSGRPAVAQFLIGNPELASELAPLWARALLMRPRRTGAIAAIRHTLGAIEHSRAEPEGLARLLGAAIGRELPEDERQPLCEELVALEQTEQRRRARKEKPTEDAHEQPVPALIAEALLDAFVSACVRPDVVNSLQGEGPHHD